MKTVIGQICFTPAEQKHFAEASGDWNPVHMDALAARRTHLGAPIAHGMHTVLAGLNALARHCSLHALTRMRVSFPKPLYVGDTVDFVITQHNDSSVRLVAQTSGVTKAVIDLTQDAGQDSIPLLALSTSVQRFTRNEPVDRNFEAIAASTGAKGRMDFSSAAIDMFPDAVRWLGGAPVAALTALSAIVGMQSPGLHSVFLGLDLQVGVPIPSTHMEFFLIEADDRFRRIKLQVAGGGLQGEVSAMVRMPPIEQPSLEEVAEQVQAGIFAGQNALIIGGSRGLGAYTAKAIVAGGGTATVTYAVGIDESQKLLAEIKDFGGKANMIAYDVNKTAEAQLENLPSLPTHVYYFATNNIARRTSPYFDRALYEEFHHFYITSFYELCVALYKKIQKFKVFYPSSIFVEERPRGLTEYAMAKAAGEVLCKDLPQFLPGLTVDSARLPRLATDQNASTIPVTLESTANVMLPILRAMQG